MRELLKGIASPEHFRIEVICMNIARLVTLFLLVFLLRGRLLSQRPEAEETKLPVATQWTLDAADPLQRSSLSSVFLLVMPGHTNEGNVISPIKWTGR
jgi:hypothetical protein